MDYHIYYSNGWEVKPTAKPTEVISRAPCSQQSVANTASCPSFNVGADKVIISLKSEAFSQQHQNRHRLPLSYLYEYLQTEIKQLNKVKEKSTTTQQPTDNPNNPKHEMRCYSFSVSVSNRCFVIPKSCDAEWHSVLFVLLLLLSFSSRLSVLKKGFET